MPPPGSDATLFARCGGAEAPAGFARRGEAATPVRLPTLGQPGMNRMAMTTLDLVGLNCPLPALKTRRALARLLPGDMLRVQCSDPLAAIDIPNLVRETGDRLASAQQSAGRLVFVIEKAPALRA